MPLFYSTYDQVNSTAFFPALCSLPNCFFFPF